jgi:hypothetical protein
MKIAELSLKHKRLHFEVHVYIPPNCVANRLIFLVMMNLLQPNFRKFQLYQRTSIMDSWQEQTLETLHILLSLKNKDEDLRTPIPPQLLLSD